MKILLYFIFGILGGLLGGMGMGGGTLLIPMLTLIMKLSQIEAQGINLVVFIPMAIASLIFHIKNKLVEFKSTYLLCIVGVIFSILGSIVAGKIDSKNLKIYFGIFLLVLGILQGISLIWEKKKQMKNNGSR